MIARLQGLNDHAHEEFNRCLQYRREDDQAWTLKAMLHMESKHFNLAQEKFEHIRQHNPRVRVEVARIDNERSRRNYDNNSN